MKIALLTSSRADYGIYLPLLKALKNDPFFDLNIVAFGTHLSKKYGATINQIFNDGFEVAFQIDTMPDGENPADISFAMGKTLKNFSKIWTENSFDLIIALGDRYEMFAACASVISFGVPIAHIHGGEKTLGAIDDIFRHCITQMATYHFTIAEVYKQRVIEIKGGHDNVYDVGALSIDNLKAMELLSVDEFKIRYGIDLYLPSILITFHPETVDFENNQYYIEQLIEALEDLPKYQFIITMPNTDTMGNIIREKIKEFVAKNENAVGIESFGVLGYLSCMKHCTMMLGNTSSGFVEASFFPKYVINLGERQSGRLLTANINNCKIEKEEILAAVKQYHAWPLNKMKSIYGQGNSAVIIRDILKSNFN